MVRSFHFPHSSPSFFLSFSLFRTWITWMLTRAYYDLQWRCRRSRDSRRSGTRPGRRTRRSARWSLIRPRCGRCVECSWAGQMCFVFVLCFWYRGLFLALLSIELQDAHVPSHSSVVPLDMRSPLPFVLTLKFSSRFVG
ncbi:hypothetical protein BDW22DRAFT_702900 [Trametopsis cervina]|nr:hypothetical protein BDW22DRAFT_702900 [Trametopsis cervina]